ncbi:4-(cytidine 5'-diphospho)-2-C-methyl-D-erythritol kinase [Zavarzinia aquatilis]|uniref:4-diphosphocytidyl-2-C-methyl-D-erythritol kinase n=1 Tax=Zavarzinia aquatilis TaxID=2211142 RepID=A0A317E2R2_9PROT|nr:4-(cytidine 5'-diphospho)-2-C-methyl-D-erythritol kinase [Zavarzinia aquatilis]PWR21289.1 4-(cytidine 5'-diphospho)-2-C-methyl-D-erythritol kinase [Zavarzinia aquatilis]
MQTDALAGLAPAKVNLYLHVTGRRADGYHLLDSLVVFADIGDRVAVEPLAEGRLRLEIGGPFAAALDGDIGDNLVLRAARALRDAAGRAELGAAIRLDKNLPVTAGLGGGSADAAAALRLLRRLWSLDLGNAVLKDIALGLGADVPVCLDSQPRHMTGIGEVVTPVRGEAVLADMGIVLVNPRQGLPTPAVFRALAGRFGAAQPLSELPADAADVVAALAARRNDLQSPAIELCPVIGEIIETLGATDGVLLARMSGSGATCFGLCADRTAARSAALHLRGARPDWWVAGGGLWQGREEP